VHNAKIELRTSEGYPPVVNSPRETELARRAVLATLGESGVVAMDYPSMGAEDFSFYLQKMPGCYVRFGARRRENEYIPLHSPAFDIHEDVLKIGAAFFEQVARDALVEYAH
jgi:metal-dependent amidase/aminoacylase/carboxypeptidase family protein